jgi:hypothetical protein
MVGIFELEELAARFDLLPWIFSLLLTELEPGLRPFEGVLWCTGSMMAIVLDFCDEALIRSMISLGRASLIL